MINVIIILIKPHLNIKDHNEPNNNLIRKDDIIIKNINCNKVWPFDGYNNNTRYFEYSHCLLFNDSLKIKWPKNENDIACNQWKYILCENIYRKNQWIYFEIILKIPNLKIICYK